MATSMAVIRDALPTQRERKPVLVDVVVDYSKHTRFTQGIVKTNLERFDSGPRRDSSVAPCGGGSAADDDGSRS